MDDEPLYLKQNIQVEPLVDQWYAWAQLIPPATCARNITERHLRIMDSYISAPELHAAAVRNPKMLGGPFIDYGGRRVGEIRALCDETRRRRAPLIELSNALVQLDTMLRTNARGLSMHPLYASVPDPLKGYVELTYDMNHQPSFRLLEALMYRAGFHDPTAQSLLLSGISGDDRPFVLSTPRLPSSDQVHLRLPFADARVDALFRLKTEPRPWAEIQWLLEPEESQVATLKSFFTTEPPPPYEPYRGPGLRWRYFGHACILVETRGMSILFDPVLSYTYESGISRYTYLDLPDTIDYVVITHNHIDHLLFETLLQLRHKIRHVLVPRNSPGRLEDPSMRLLLKHCGFRSVVELTDLEAIEDGPLSITGLPFFGEHGDLAVASKLAYLVRIGSEQILVAADSCNIEPRLYRHLHDLFGDVRTLFVGMECNGAPMSWLYGPLMLQRTERAIDESRRLNGSDYEKAIDIVNTFNCRDVYVYAMGQEPWLNYVMSIKYTEQSRPIVESNRLIAECRARGITSERLFGEKEIFFEPDPECVSC